jgi:hypothetical protein
LTAKGNPPAESAPARTLHEVRTPPKSLRPEVRIQAAPPPPPAGTAVKGGGIQWIPWSELSGGQRAGRVLAALVVVFIVFSFTRTVLRGLSGGVGGSSATSPTAESSDVPMTEGDRRDGIESLCRVFQIYGMPKTDKDAEGSVRNAAELFKLGGNQSPERSLYILKTIARQFRAGTLGAPDCTQVGAAVGGATDNADTPSAGPTR